jgi:hypothetical protein
MSQTQGTHTTDNSRHTGSIPGLSTMHRTGLPCTPVQCLSTFRTSAHPSNIFCASGEAPPSLSPSISAHISAVRGTLEEALQTTQTCINTLWTHKLTQIYFGDCQRIFVCLLPSSDSSHQSGKISINMGITCT